MINLFDALKVTSAHAMCASILYTSKESKEEIVVWLTKDDMSTISLLLFTHNLYFPLLIFLSSNFLLVSVACSAPRKQSNPINDHLLTCVWAVPPSEEEGKKAVVKYTMKQPSGNQSHSLMHGLRCLNSKSCSHPCRDHWLQPTSLTA